MKILNLYAGIGGNRKNWGNEHEITAVEYEPKIAAVYQDMQIESGKPARLRLFQNSCKPMQ